ncbi:MAG: EF-hand domain-containing protein, partial [Steroidobacteraceae bacterium]|nr:EF-hand domain-containing protein [Steroidobacteraceae bacterium]
MKPRICGALLAVGLAGAAWAGGPEGRPRIDTNGDGQIDLAELQAVRPNVTAEEFNRIDKNGDGLLSREELRGAWRDFRGPPIDSNGDGVISYEELKAKRPSITPEQFAAMDADG